MTQEEIEAARASDTTKIDGVTRGVLYYYLDRFEEEMRRIDHAAFGQLYELVDDMREELNEDYRKDHPT